jgi:hypothetical protein
MPETTNLDSTIAGNNAINNSIRMKNDLAINSIGKFRNNTSPFWGILQGARLFDQSKAKLFRICGTIEGNIAHDLLQILDGSGRKDYLEIPEGSCFATSSNGTPSPRSN